MTTEVEITKPAVKAITLGKAIDSLWALREEKREAESKIKLIEAKIGAAESILFDKLDAEDTESGKGKSASVTISKATSFNIEDFDLVKMAQKWDDNAGSNDGTI